MPRADSCLIRQQVQNYCLRLYLGFPVIYMVRYMNGFHNFKTPVETGTSPENKGNLRLPAQYTAFSLQSQVVFLFLPRLDLLRLGKSFAAICTDCHAGIILIPAGGTFPLQPAIAVYADHCIRRIPRTAHTQRHTPDSQNHISGSAWFRPFPLRLLLPVISFSSVWKAALRTWHRWLLLEDSQNRRRDIFS